MSSDAAIQIKDLSKCYRIYNKPHDRFLQMIMRNRKQYFREFWALKNVSIEIKKGETVGIIGRNGSGKSTLLQIICETLNYTSGQLKTNGRIAALLELGSGFNPEFTGRENIYLNGAVLGLTKKEIDDRYEDIISFADIGNFIDEPVKTFSSGMLVRLAFAVIAHVDAEILIIDEALSVGDIVFTQKCMRFINKFCEKNTLLFVSHDIASVTSICNRVIWIDNGEIKEQGNTKLVCEHYLNEFFSTLHSKLDSTSSQKSHKKIQRIGQTNLIWKDQREEIIAASELRNDVKIFKFDIDNCSEFGGADAKIIDVMFLDSNNCPLNWIVGGEKVCLRIVAQLFKDIHRPIIGFFIKDKLGQNIFGDNTYISYMHQPCHSIAGSKIIGEFEFYIPWLTSGDYVIAVAIADGTQEDHVHLHWIHDALVIHSMHSAVSTGTIGIPMNDIRLYNYV